MLYSAWFLTRRSFLWENFTCDSHKCEVAMKKIPELAPLFGTDEEKIAVLSRLFVYVSLPLSLSISDFSISMSYAQMFRSMHMMCAGIVSKDRMARWRSKCTDLWREVMSIRFSHASTPFAVVQPNRPCRSMVESHLRQNSS